MTREARRYTRITLRFFAHNRRSIARCLHRLGYRDIKQAGLALKAGEDALESSGSVNGSHGWSETHSRVRTLRAIVRAWTAMATAELGIRVEIKVSRRYK